LQATLEELSGKCGEECLSPVAYGKWLVFKRTLPFNLQASDLGNDHDFNDFYKQHQFFSLQHFPIVN
jgi:hypothetical protein